MKAGEEKEFKAVFPDKSPRKDLAGKEADFKVKVKSVQKMDLPEINDEFAKELGAFDTLVALKQNMKEGITMEKQAAEKQRKRGENLEKISEKVKVDLPEALVGYEKQRLMDDLKNKIIQNMKITFEQYLASVKQTEDGLKGTFQKEAEKRLKGFLVLREIGKKENIDVSDSEVEKEVSESIKSYSKEQISKIDIGQFKEYTKGVIYNEKVFEKLETFAR
jgi:trigger factor